MVEPDRPQLRACYEAYRVRFAWRVTKARIQTYTFVELVRNLVAHGDAGRGSEGETGEWSG